MKDFFKFREALNESVFKLKNYKDRDRRGHEGYMFIHIVKGNTSNKYDDDFGFTVPEMQYMDKLISMTKSQKILL